MKILLVEDDESLIAILTKSLAAYHYVVDAVKDGEAGWSYGSTFEYDLIVLDVMLPRLDGISLCQRFRAEGYTTPILLLTAQDASTAKVRGLDAGADDYMVKPIDVAELSARIRALLRRGHANPFPMLIWGELLLNPSTCEVTYAGKPLTLTTKEYELLELLMRHSQQVSSTDEILDRLWSSEEFPAEATVRSHIRRLRQKLVAVGAPSDFITTVHGRGYYLKVPEQPVNGDAALPEPTASQRDHPLAPANANPDAAATAAIDDRPLDRQAAAQTQYLAFLNQTWIASRTKHLAQLALVIERITTLPTVLLPAALQVEMQQTAHKLAGTLGTFGLMSAMQLARQLEQQLNQAQPPAIATLLPVLVALQQEIQTATALAGFERPFTQSPLLWVIHADPCFTQALETAAASHGIRTAIAPNFEQAQTWLTPEAQQPASSALPQAILLQLPATRSNSMPPQPPAWLPALAQHHPDLPIWVIGEQAEFGDRLEGVRFGGNAFLSPTVTPDQALAAVMRSLLDNSFPVKVMVVDDDQDWLRTLPLLLRPWGFKVTTLAELPQFWTVLQAVMPDVLVLDINMPQITGFELCQVLRSEPQWRRLPILFLSVLTDRHTQNRAFTIGADDYLCKPVVGSDLANRILCRLQRVRAWAN